MKPIYLASQSPRRLKILEEAGFQVQIISVEVEEVYPSDLSIDKVAAYLANLKMNATLQQHPNLKDETIITADTVVIYNNAILGKPKDLVEAKQMLTTLNGQQHKVMTGVAIYANQELQILDDTTKVYFKNLTDEAIDAYITNYEVLDKAGSYNIEEYEAIEKIEGSYTNVVGLPIEILDKEMNQSI